MNPVSLADLIEKTLASHRQPVRTRYLEYSDEKGTAKLGVPCRIADGTAKDIAISTGTEVEVHNNQLINVATISLRWK